MKRDVLICILIGNALGSATRISYNHLLEKYQILPIFSIYIFGYFLELDFLDLKECLIYLSGAITIKWI